MAAIELHIAVGADDEDAAGGQITGDELQEYEGWFVGPVEVIEDQDQRFYLASVLEERCDGVEESEAG